MVEGLAEFYGNMRIESKQVLVGAPSTSNVMLLREMQLLPISTLFDADASSPYYHEESKTSIFYAECWALMHYLMTRDRKEKTHRVTDFVELLRKRVDQREAAGRTIGGPGSLETVVNGGTLRTSYSLRCGLIHPRSMKAASKRGGSPMPSRWLCARTSWRMIAITPKPKQMLEEALKMDPKLGRRL